MRRRLPNGGTRSSAIPVVGYGAVPDGKTVASTARAIVMSYTPADHSDCLYTGASVGLMFYDAHINEMTEVPILGGALDAAGNGEIWTPNPTTRRLDTGALVSWPSDKNVPLGALDGDHVLVLFVGGRYSDPLVIGRLPHPFAAVAFRSAGMAVVPTIGHPALPDGDCRYLRHQGSVVMIDRYGNVAIDTTAAGIGNHGQDITDGGPSGKLSLTLKTTQQLEVNFGGTTQMLVTNTGVNLGGSAPTLGVARKTDPVIVDAGNLFTKLDSLATELGIAGANLVSLPETAATALVDAGLAVGQISEATGTITDASTEVKST